MHALHAVFRLVVNLQAILTVSLRAMYSISFKAKYSQNVMIKCLFSLYVIVLLLLLKHNSLEIVIYYKDNSNT